MVDIEPTECPYYLISRATLVVTSGLRKALAEANLEWVRPAYLGVLISLWKEDRLQVGELGRRAGLEPSTMTGLLDRMERDGLLARTRDPNDRRALRIVLTDKGRGVREPAMEVVESTLDWAFDGLDDNEIDVVKSSLKRVLDNAQQRSRS